MAPPKAKTQKMSLGDFLGDQSLGSWADQMEDMPLASNDSRTGYGGERRGFNSGYGMERGFSDRGGFQPREQLPLPTKPPFTAHLGNLSFDATEGDIQDFFGDCEVTNVRIVEDKLERKPKGFGYVEFGSLDGLKKALDLSGEQFQGRNIRVSVADPPKDRPERENLDWTRRGPLPDLPNARRPSERSGGGGGGFRNYETASDAGSERGERRRPPPESDGKVRDFSNWERKGPLSPLPSSGPPREGGRGRGDAPPRERKVSPAWGEGRPQEGPRPPRREFQEKPQQERQPTASEMDNQWRSRMKPDAPPKSPTATPDASTPSSPAAAQPATNQRPRLNLQKRTVPDADTTPASATSSDSKASPFGGARPIDTAAREKQVEEKRQLAIRAKKEQDDKARDEKKAREDKSKNEKEKGAQGEASDSGTKEASEGDSKENGAGAPAPGRNYEILRRMTDEGDADKTTGESANGDTADQKAPKAHEMARQSSRGGEGSWRRKSSTPAASGPTAEGVEEDGWSTVPQKSKNNRRGGNQGTRAVAS